MKYTKIFLIILAQIIFFCNLQAKVLINEAMPCNLSTFNNTDNYNFSGYLEFKNTDTADVNLESYVITHYKLKKGGIYELKWSWNIDHNFNIPAESYKTMWFDEESSDGHSPYKLDADGGYITLYNGPELVDSISYGVMNAHISYGRYETRVGYMEPTPALPNSFCVSSITNRCAKPKFGTIPGIKKDSTTISLSTATKGATIYYTTDCTEPSKDNGTIYTDPFTISSNKNIRARAYKEGILPSVISTGSYIFEDSQHSNCGGFTVPVVSITTNKDYLTNDTIGIAVVGTNGISGEKSCTSKTANYNQDWKRPMNFEYIVNKNQVLSQEIEAAVEGGCSRTEPIKSLSLKASKKTGLNLLTYQFFSCKPNIEHQTLHLRNGGTAYGKVRFRDGLMQTFAIGMNIDYQAYQPVAYYLNGEYMGLMGLRERTNADYIKANYGYDEEEIDLVSLSDQMGIRASKGDLNAYNALVDYLENNSPTTSTYYEGACRLMDMDNYIDYQIIQQFMVNVDWPGNNTKLWRTKKNGRFRWMLYDMDMGLGLPGYNYLGDESKNMITWCKGEGSVSWGNREKWMTTVFKNLSKNEEFKNKFATKYLLHLATTFSEKRIQTVFDSITAILDNEYCAYSKGTSAESAAVDMKNFALNRADYILDDLLEYVGGDSLIDLTIKSNISGAMFVMNGECVSSYNGKYFSNYNLDLQVYPPWGYKFIRWETSPSLDINNQPTITYSVMSGNETWKYYYTDAAPIGNWTINGYNDASWDSGTGRFGYNTVTDNRGYNVSLNYGEDPENKYITAYFRSSFSISDLSNVIKLKGRITFDDGYIIYINGQKVDQMNMNDSASYSTLATTYANDDVREFTIDPAYIQEGTNVIAVEVHQTAPNSSDLTFEFSLSAVANENSNSDRVNEVLFTTVKSDQTITAIFEKESDTELPTLLINEVCASSNSKSNNPDDYSDYPDWIEIYNNGSKTYDLAGMYLSNDINNPTKSQIPYGYEQTVIKPGEHKILWAKGNAVEGPLYLNFKINADKELQILLSCILNNNLKTLDDVTYKVHPTNASYGRTNDASLDWMVFDLCNDSLFSATPSVKNGTVMCPQTSDMNELTFFSESLSVYPNPASYELYISSEENMRQIIIYEHTGKIVKEKKIDNNRFKLNVSNWNRGVYILHVITDNRVYQKKFIKQ